jgi:hypothetical protein
MPLNKRHHHRIQKIKIAQTMNITKHNNKNGTTMRRSKKLFLHRCCNSVVSLNGLKNIMMMMRKIFYQRVCAIFSSVMKKFGIFQL